MRDWPMRVISWSSLTDSSSRSSTAMMRSRVESDRARRAFKVEDIAGIKHRKTGASQSLPSLPLAVDEGPGHAGHQAGEMRGVGDVRYERREAEREEDERKDETL